MNLNRVWVKIGIITVTFLASFVMVSFSWAATYYVDATNGNDAKTGLAESTPWQTIAKVNASKFNPGDQILFKGGETWREQLTVPSTGSAGNPITIGGYGSGADPIINGSDILSSWTNVPVNHWYASVTADPKQVFFNGTRGTRVSDLTSLNSASQWYFDGANLVYVYSVGIPTSTIEASSRNRGIYLNGNSYITLQNISAKNAKQDGIWLGNAGSGITVDGVNSSYNYWTGMKTISGTSTSTIILQNSTFTYNGGSGALLSSLANSTIQSNSFNYNTQIFDGSDEQLTWIAGLRITGTNSGNNIIQNNTASYNTNGAGIWIDFNGTGNIIRYNWVEGNYNPGIFNEITSGTQIYYNVSVNNTGSSIAAGIYIEGRNGTPPWNAPANSNEVYNNVMYGNGKFGLIIQNGDGFQGNCHGNIIKNNIMIGTTNGPNLRVGGSAELESNTFSNNCLGAQATNFIEWGWGAYKSTYAAWETAYGGTTHSLQSDPFFVSTVTSDFHLQSTSPAINAGVGVGLMKDFDGNLISGVPDIGALEFIQMPPRLPPRNLRIVP